MSQQMGMADVHAGVFGHDKIGGLPSAFGYTQYAHQYQDEVVTPFLQNWMKASIGDFISRSNCANFRCGDTAIFRMMGEPRVHVFDDKNQDMKLDRMSFTSKTIVLNKYFYSNIKLDDFDKRYWCDLPEIASRWSSMLGNKFARQGDKTILLEILKNVPCYNQGNMAGAECRSYKLGEKSCPVWVSMKNVHAFIAACMGVLDETCQDAEGQPYMILPTCMKTIIKLNPNLNEYWMAGPCVSCSPLRTGVHDREVGGFTLIFTDMIPKTRLGNKIGYHILFGYREATCFARGFEKFATIQMERGMGEINRAVMGWGAGSLYPDLTGRAFICIQT